MSKAERGTKRACGACGGKFYDLNREPIVCPLCQVTVTIEQPQPRAKTPSPAPEPEKAAEEPAPVEPEVPEAPSGGPEIVSLSEVADEEASDDDVDIADDVIDLGDDADSDDIPEADDDDTFLEADDEEGSDVTDIIPGGRKADEET